MRAVTFDVSVPKYLLGKAFGGLSDSLFFGAPSGVSLVELAEPTLPADDWVRLEVLHAGVCGTDVATLTFGNSPSMEPFVSFPAVLGHEILGRVVEVGPAVRRVEVGQRVAVDPFVSCTMRGFDATKRCPSCSSGLHCTCERAAEEGELIVSGERMRPGTCVGFHASLPGGWSERIIAHESHCFAVDDALSNRTAALIEPLSIAMHAALNMRPFGDGPAFVIGSGPIALGVVWALRAAGFEGELVAQVKRAHEADIARALGASAVVAPGDQAREALSGTGARAYKPIIGDEVYAGGGFPLIFDCVGSGESLTQSIRYATPRARIVVIGCAPQIPKLDLSFLWARELDIKGFVGYSLEDWHGERRHTFEITHDLLVETGSPVEQMVTHVFALGDYRKALSVAANRRQSGSIKVLLDPAAGSGA